MSRVELSLGHRNMTYIRSCNITRDLVWKYNPGGWYEVSSRIVRDITQDSTVHSVIPQGVYPTGWYIVSDGFRVWSLGAREPQF